MFTRSQSKLVESESKVPAQATSIMKAPGLNSRILHHTHNGIAVTPYNSPANAVRTAAATGLHAASSLRGQTLMPPPPSAGEQVRAHIMAKMLGPRVDRNLVTDEDSSKAQADRMVPIKE